MPDKKNDEKKLEALFDALADSVLKESDDEILEELRMSGFDMNTENRRIKKMLLDTVKAFRQRPLEAARAAYKRQIEQYEKKPYSIPESAQERRKLFTLFTQNPRFEQYVTVQYRDLEELTDNDIKTYLEDLAELGILQELKGGETDDGKE